MNCYYKYVLKVIDFIENNLNDDISISDIVSVAGYSKFHFIRIFKEISKDTIFEYIRKRRLTSAAIDLIETDIPVLDIAFKYSYNSQEAFTRAFQTYYGMPPKIYRKRKVHLSNLYKMRIGENDLKIKNEDIELKYEIVQKREFYIIGIEYKGKNEKREIPKLFNEFMDNINKIQVDIVGNGVYGFETWDDEFYTTGEFGYLAAIEVLNAGEVPKGMVMKKVEANKYAVIALPSTVEDIQSITNKIYMRLLEEENLEPIEDFAFEFYSRDYKPNGKGKSAYYFIPIKQI